MAILTEDMKRVVREQRLGFYATLCEDGSPNLSPKGTTDVWDDDHLFFADIRSPQTIANIRRGSLVEVNVVDPYDDGTTTETDMIRAFQARFARLHERLGAPRASPSRR